MTTYDSSKLKQQLALANSVATNRGIDELERHEVDYVLLITIQELRLAYDELMSTDVAAMPVAARKQLVDKLYSLELQVQRCADRLEELAAS